jgi:DNA-binding helix-hairpin-helix protein with protein kinase domain
VGGHPDLLLKIMSSALSPEQVAKLEALALWPNKPVGVAMPTELVNDLPTGKPVGFLQPFYRRAVPLTQLLDSYGRRQLRFPDDLSFRVKLCRLLAEAFARVHAENLVIGDVSDGNFLIGRDRFGRAGIAYVIDCNSFQVTIRTAQGNAFFPSGVATEEYAAPEVQPTDWATSPRSVYTDSFGLAVLLWKLIFNRAHPFAVVTPRSVDVPPMGERIEDRLFPFSPARPLPASWQAPDVQPPLSVLPFKLRESFFKTFSTDDPRDRTGIDDWCKLLSDWEVALTPSIPLRVVRKVNHSFADRLSRGLSHVQPHLGKAVVALVIGFMMLGSNPLTLLRSSPQSFTAPVKSKADKRFGISSSSSLSPTSPTKPIAIDIELFPEPIWNPNAKEPNR